MRQYPPFVGSAGGDRNGPTKSCDHETLLEEAPPQTSPSYPIQPAPHAPEVPCVPAELPQKQKAPDCVPANTKLLLAHEARHTSLVIRLDHVTCPARSRPAMPGSGEYTFSGGVVVSSAKHAKAPLLRGGKLNGLGTILSLGTGTGACI